MSGQRDPSNDDVALFRSAVGDAAPLPQDKVPPQRRARAPVPEKTLENRQQTLADSLNGAPCPTESETGEELLFLRPGYQYRLLRRLRRGHFTVSAELDLHGMTAAEAKERLSEFLKECRRHGLHCVRIIHGKGRRSPQGRPILKAKLDRWLRLRDEVVAFSSARPVDGGTGAVYVLLKGA